jgi:hypothetical protein
MRLLLIMEERDYQFTRKFSFLRYSRLIAVVKSKSPLKPKDGLNGAPGQSGKTDMGSQPAVEAPECARKHERHNEYSCTERENVQGLTQIEAAHATDQQVAEGEIEEAPQYIYRRRGQAYPWWRREGTLERVPRDSIAQVRDSVGKERAPEEVRNKMVPAHRYSFRLPSHGS